LQVAVVVDMVVMTHRRVPTVQVAVVLVVCVQL
jgi:hypothetical protein